MQVRLDAPEKLVLPDLNHGGVAAENHRRVVHVADVDLRQAPRDRRLRFERRDDAGRQLRPELVGHRLRGGSGFRIGVRGEAVHQRQIEIGIPRSVLIDDDAAAVDEVHLALDPADPDRLALRDRDLDRPGKRPAQRGVTNPGRGQQPSPPRVEIRPQQVFATQTVQDGEHFTIRQPFVAHDHDPIDAEHVCVRRDRRQAIPAVRDERRRGRVLQHRANARAPVTASAPRLHVCAAKSSIGRSRDRAHDESASINRAGSAPIDPAPRVITTSPGRATR